MVTMLDMLTKITTLAYLTQVAGLVWTTLTRWTRSTISTSLLSHVSYTGSVLWLNFIKIARTTKPIHTRTHWTIRRLYPNEFYMWQWKHCLYRRCVSLSQSLVIKCFDSSGWFVPAWRLDWQRKPRGVVRWHVVGQDRLSLRQDVGRWHLVEYGRLS